MAIFEASPEGFRAQNLGRPPAHLVRELIQNVFDEAATRCIVTVRHTPKKGVYVQVHDDVPGGFRDEKLIFTIWQSDKQDIPTKRGRMGRGLKELVSVSDRTLVATEGRKATVFTRDEHAEWNRKLTSDFSVTKGTSVEAWVSAWKAKDATDIITYLRKVRPPTGLTLIINEEPVVRHAALESYKMWLPSVVFEMEGNERKTSNRSFETTVELFSETKSWVYEMGLPIEEIDFPLSIDVQQRVPLREQRDTLLEYYRRQLYAQLLSSRIAHIPVEQMRDNWVLDATKSTYHLSNDAKLKVAQAWTQGKPFAASPQTMSIATGQHIEVVNLRTMPEGIRDIVKLVGKDVRETMREMMPELCPPTQSLTDTHRRLLKTWEWIAEGIGRQCYISVADGRPSAQASFEPGSRRLTLYREMLGDDWFKWPLKAKQLSVLIHELSHWEQLEESHGVDFHSDVEHVGGEVAQFLLENPFEATGMALQGD